MKRRLGWMTLAAAGITLLPAGALADEGLSPGLFAANKAWMMLCAGLVLIMHVGFASVESGLTRVKHTVNILFKNTFIGLGSPQFSATTELATKTGHARKETS